MLVRAAPQRPNAWRWGLAFVLAAQCLIYGYRITDGFYDGRRHTNWGPPFWLMAAEQMHKVRFWTDGRAGIVSQAVETPAGPKPGSWYASHPQFIAIPLYLWTGAFGLSEWSARALAGAATLLASLLLWLAVKERHGPKRATLFAAFWAALPALVVYGRNPNQESFVMLFLALAALAHEKVLAGDPRWRWPWAASIAGMLWSDWSGWVFAGLFFAACAVRCRKEVRLRPLVLHALLGGLLGVVVVGAQLAAERPAGFAAQAGAAVASAVAPRVGTAAPASAPSAIVRGLWAQYQGRSGAGIPWGDWGGKQLLYFETNFTPLLGFLGLAWALGALARGMRAGAERPGGRASIGTLFLLAAVGTLVYALVVRDASFVHVFFQYYYSLLIAWGLASFVDWSGAALAARRLPRLVEPALVAAMLVFLLRPGFAILNDTGWGGPAEMALLKSIKSFGPQATVGVIGSLEDAWLAHPNVEYYSGRRIWSMYPEDAAKKDLVLLTPGDRSVQEAALGALADPGWRFELRSCTSLLCLWQRTRGAKRPAAERPAAARFAGALDAEKALMPNYVRTIPLSTFAGSLDALRVGVRVQASTKGGKRFVGTVTAIGKEDVTVSVESWEDLPKK